MLKIIPQVHEFSSRFYWETVFPSMHTHRMKYPWPNHPGIVVDGDVTVDDDNKFYCNRCNSNIHQLVPEMFGSIDVGYELVYKCPECNEMICRIYSEETTSADNL